MLTTIDPVEKNSQALMCQKQLFSNLAPTAPRQDTPVVPIAWVTFHCHYLWDQPASLPDLSFPSTVLSPHKSSLVHVLQPSEAKFCVRTDLGAYLYMGTNLSPSSPKVVVPKLIFIWNLGEHSPLYKQNTKAKCSSLSHKLIARLPFLTNAIFFSFVFPSIMFQLQRG